MTEEGVFRGVRTLTSYVLETAHYNVDKHCAVCEQKLTVGDEVAVGLVQSASLLVHSPSYYCYKPMHYRCAKMVRAGDEVTIFAE